MSACERNRNVDWSPEFPELSAILAQQPDWFQDIMSKPEAFELQIRYTKINRDAEGNPHFTTFTLNENADRYFYPASTIKLPVAALALEELRRIDDERIDLFTQMSVDSTRYWQTPSHIDTLVANQIPSLATHIEKTIIVSDNDAHNRLFEFVGHERTNKLMWERGYNSVLFSHQLANPLRDEQNRVSPPVRFIENNQTIFSIPERISNLQYPNSRDIFRGKKNIYDDELIYEPFNFRDKNNISIRDLQKSLIALVFPESVPEKMRFQITEEDRRFLLRIMGLLPNESSIAYYRESETYYDSYVKFFMFGDEMSPMPENVRILNKVGLAYGYILDNAYIVDFENGIEFFLTAVILVNENQTFNDNTYEYEEIGIPFLHTLGTMIYEYEKNRERAYQSDLTEFKSLFHN